MTVLGTAVVGGGAAGMMAAISAAQMGEKVSLLEGNQQLGRKILVSGNGRCNLTNREADSLGHYHGTQAVFARDALAAFPLQQTLEFFEHLGIETREEKRQRLFPVSDQARSVVDVLEDRLRALGVQVLLGVKVCELAAESGRGFRLVAGSGQRFAAERVILSSGGISVSKLGADASGMDLATSVGHSRTELCPGLVPLLSPDRAVRRMKGVRVRAEVSAHLPGHRRPITDTDDLLLTAYGVSGFTILNLSAQLVPALAQAPVVLTVNLFPGHSAEQVSEVLSQRWNRHPHRTLALSFAGLLHSRVAGAMIHRLELASDVPVSSLTKAQRWRLAQGLTAWQIEVTGPHSFDHAEVTIGGVRTEEINPETMESYLVPGLYLAGEMVDVHGDLGGFNFQWAWASGYLAGQARGA
ncbi:NAD(P)/FAD-dependent oxidoreductase [Candidatus Latescibacterota bacterium]